MILSVITIILNIVIVNIISMILSFMLIFRYSSYDIPETDHEFNNNFTIFFTVILYTVFALTAINIVIPFARDKVAKKIIYKNYRYSDNQLYINTNNPKTIKRVKYNSSIMAYMSFKKCIPVRTITDYTYWAWSKGNTLKWSCYQKH